MLCFYIQLSTPVPILCLSLTSSTVQTTNNQLCKLSETQLILGAFLLFFVWGFFFISLAGCCCFGLVWVFFFQKTKERFEFYTEKHEYFPLMNVVEQCLEHPGGVTVPVSKADG